MRIKVQQKPANKKNIPTHHQKNYCPHRLENIEEVSNEEDETIKPTDEPSPEMEKTPNKSYREDPIYYPLDLKEPISEQIETIEFNDIVRLDQQTESIQE